MKTVSVIIFVICLANLIYGQKEVYKINDNWMLVNIVHPLPSENQKIVKEKINAAFKNSVLDSQLIRTKCTEILKLARKSELNCVSDYKILDLKNYLTLMFTPAQPDPLYRSC